MTEYKAELEGKGGITARLVAHSKSEVDGKEIATFELVYPRFIHSEFMTHRLFSRNASSSRAIPIKKTIQAVKGSPARPIHWGKNQPGMQAKSELLGWRRKVGEASWNIAAKAVGWIAKAMDKVGVHKQVANRILEPFQFIKVVVTATDYNNWFWLRDHEDAQPEIAEVARLMKGCLDESKPTELGVGEWHLPYVKIAVKYDNAGINSVANAIGQEIKENGPGSPRQRILLRAMGMTLDEALKVSSSCCAQVSFRKSDQSVEKAVRIYDRLVESEPVHASPFEHQATPMGDFPVGDGINWPEGVTHMDRNGDYWSGNFCSWIQHRQLIPNHAKRG